MDCKHPNIKSGYEAPYELAWCTHCGYITWCGDGLIPQGAEKSTDYTDWVRAHVRAWACNAEAAGRGLCERWCGHHGCPAVLVGTTQVPDLAARVARLESLLSRAQPSHSHSIKCRDSNSDENCLRCAIDAARKEGT